MASDPDRLPLWAKDDDGDPGVNEGARPPPDWTELQASRRDRTELYDDPPRTGGRGGWRLGRAAVALAALAGFAGVLWYAYQWGLAGGEESDLPIVTAEGGPAKVKPEDPGGLAVPYQDQMVLNQDAGSPETPQVERLLPPPETPMPVPAEEEMAAIEPQAAPQGETAAPAAETQESAASATAEEAAAPAPEPPAAEEVPEEPAAKPQPAAKAEPSAPSAAQVAALAEGAAADGGFVVQLVSLRSDEAARGAWSGLQEKFPKLLGGLTLIVDSATVEGIGEVYRVRTGPFSTQAAAADLCARLKAERQDCLVVRR